MALQRRGGCTTHHTNPPHDVDLTVLVTLLNTILVQVSDHNQTVAIDLNPIIAKLTQIINAMANLESTIGLTTTAINNLTLRFIAEITNIAGLESQEILILQSLHNDERTIIDILNEMKTLKTINRFIFDFNYVVGDAPATILIPAGAVELTVLTGCYAYKATIGTLKTWIDAGDDISVEFRNTIAGVLAEPSYLLELPAHAKCHINYTALTDIGHPMIDGDVSLYQGVMVLDDDDIALQAAIDTASTIINP
jgi:hypothetical protein